MKTYQFYVTTKCLVLFCLVLSFKLYSQTAIYVSGNIRIHEEGQIGFHTNLINNASFDENLGLAGFYGPGSINISGAFMPIFFDTEIANNAGVNLSTSVGVTNNTNFIAGDFVSPRNQTNVYYNFIDSAFNVGEANNSKIDGYAAISNKQSFTFPIGDAGQLRPLILNSQEVNMLAKCAYFFEDPNNPNEFPGFNTEIRPQTIAAISVQEFWRLEGTISSTVTLNWNARSNLADIAEDVSSITLVGWSNTLNRWQSLGTVAIGGDLDNGFVTSASFIPNGYEVITFGSLAEPTDIISLPNYLLTPNGDGINDFLVIPELDQSPNNSLRIYDRNGLKVFEMFNYTDEFGGVSNMDNLVINRDQGLPEGVYFYLISMDDLGLNYQGFLYLDR